MKRLFFILVSMTFLCAVSVDAAVLFQDNFDSNCSGTACLVTGGASTYPTGWDQWYTEQATATYGGVTHYSGEISTPGRGGTGKSLKLWRYGSAFGGYDGGLLKVLSYSISNLHMRFYIKVPSAMNWATGDEYQKLWRFNTSGSEIYVNINNGFRSGIMQVYDSSEWVTVLNNSQLLSIMDGNWHCVEFQFGLNISTLKVWIDGVSVYSNTSKNWHGNAGAIFNGYFQHFGLGNRGSSVTYQSSWQAMEFDDLVIADQYIGPVSGGDTTAPTVSMTAPAAGTVSGTVTVSATASDNVGVTGVQFKVDGNNIGSEDTSSPYSMSWNTASVSNGSHTLTATARDAAGNQTTSTAVTVTVQNASSDAVAPTVSITSPAGGATLTGSATLTANASDNVGVAGVQFKLDGVNVGQEDTSSPYSFVLDSTTVTNGTHSLTAVARDAAGNQTTSSAISVTIQNSAATVLFSEGFDNSSVAARGWYDNTAPAISTTEHIPGSTGSLQFRFPVGATSPVSGGAMRRKFTESDAVYVSYYVKYSANWTGSNQPYHPHEFYLLTNKNGDWDGLAYDRLTVYIEQNEGEPLIAIQDGQNIDESRVGQDLTAITEQRSVAGCNGDSDGYGNGACYLADTVHWNGKFWRSGTQYFSDNAGPYYKNDWHHIAVYLKLNSISGGKAVKNGIMKYWYDGNLIIDHNNVVFRTGQHADMKFNQFVIAPWIGDGSPVDQTFWVDNLEVSSSAPTEVPSPQNLRLSLQ